MRIATVAAIGSLAGSGLAAQQRVVVQGLATAEAWSTDPRSRLLARNDGNTALLGSLRLWSAAALRNNLLFLAVTDLEGGAATAEDRVTLELEQLTLRWTIARPLVIDAGRFPSPLGAFAPRRLPDVNPLVGVPDLYPVDYPWGGQVSGVLGLLDYRLAVVDRPASNKKYVPAGGARARFVSGLGVSPTVGVRVGASFTAGPYLSREIAPSLASGASWDQFGQKVLGVDAAFSRGYLEVRGEAALSSYEVPGHPESVDGTAYYVEAKYTWAPRFFTALRIEHNKYAFIRPIPGPAWMGVATTFSDAEFGLGYRLGAHTLLKASVRADSWDVPASLRSVLPNGHAIAVQLSHGFDVTAIVAGKQ